MNNSLNILVQKAKEGDKQALESVVLQIKDLIYNLSLRMLLYPEDAMDATQEILIKVITHLGTFKGESTFTTWVYRVASNYLLTEKGKKSQHFAMPFEQYEILIDTGQYNEVRYTQNEGELRLLEEEVKVSCTHGLLLCLTERDRMIYILGEILEFNGKEGAEILGISHTSFRKQLSRSRSKIRSFLENKCGLANPENPCRCTKKIDYLIDQKVVDPISLRFAPHSNRSIDLVEKIADLERSAAIYRSTPEFPTQEQVWEEIKQTIQAI